ncbi:hypothetical protein [Halorubrum aethiopicum]|uniref:hypothetical protein n=1 Tax=Halorubrum aethiopicum TaxID=1758255 RepID=UPI00082EFA6B|nr:hypothetical protein [Halorubrum aethiopicum]
MTGEEGDGSSDLDGPGDGDGSGSVDGTRLARRWRSLDRGWQALCLGLAIVAAHIALYPVP